MDSETLCGSEILSFLQPEQDEIEQLLTSALEREKTHPLVPPQTPGSMRTSPSLALLTDSSSSRVDSQFLKQTTSRYSLS